MEEETRHYHDYWLLRIRMPFVRRVEFLVPVEGGRALAEEHGEGLRA